jgi:hypothetical protein
VAQYAEEEFKQSLVGQAFYTYIEYLGELTSLSQYVRGTWGVILKGLNFIGQLGNAGPPPLDPNQNQRVLHGLITIGAWSALEAYVGDFCKAAMQEQPQILDADAIKNIKVPISELLATDADKPDRILKAVEEKFARARGVGRFEDVLNVFGLGGTVPLGVKRHILLAQKIRNVWAHNAGKADAQFLEGGFFANHGIGDKVFIDAADTDNHVAAILMYGNVVTNRWRARFGFGPIPLNGNMYLIDEYQSLYPGQQVIYEPPASE